MRRLKQMRLVYLSAFVLLHICHDATQTASGARQVEQLISDLDNGSAIRQQQDSTNRNKAAQQESSRRQYSSGNNQLAEDEYLVGVGIADITGPAADINLMGYAKPNQDSSGIHLRQFCRSLLIEDRDGTRLLYINLDNGMISQLLRTNVLNRLKQQYGPSAFNETNVMLTATHSHSCPGGFFQYMLYNIPSAGFISQTLDALTNGVLRSVQRSLASVQEARIFFIKGDLPDASINRSPTAYANNPAEERAKYKHDTDKEMFLLRIVDRQNQPLAMVNWFAVHGTSMNNSNHLISSDNKGYAALLFERDLNPAGSLPGKGKFVAIFAQANEGDVSPNTQGPRCVDTGLPCDPVTSTCGSPARNEKCIAFGPGRDMFESTQIIAYKQYYKAKQLFADTRGQEQVRGPLRFVHEHIDITQQIVPPYESAVRLMTSREQKNLQLLNRRQQEASSSSWNNIGRRKQLAGKLQNNVHRLAATNGSYHTCRAALGYSFAAGTTDGPGAFDFQQGDTVSTKYWNMVRDFIKRPSASSIECHHPKPILLATGQMDFPYMWHPRIVPTQLFMIGQVALVGLPGEFTTMAGRRVREAVRQALSAPISDHQNDPLVVEETRKMQEGDDQRHQSLLHNNNNIDNNNNSNNQHAQDAGTSENGHKQKQVEVVLSGLSNIYTSYITTIEEYELQRYEGASTLYGPHTLQAYVNQFTKLAHRLFNNVQPIDPLQPPDLSASLFTLKAGVIFDSAPHRKDFGSVLQDADSTRVYRARERVTVTFVAGNPRNDLLQEQSFLYVEQFNETSRSWTVVATDASWETKFIWERTNSLFGESVARIEWDIPADCDTGIYRIRHIGAHKSLLKQTIGHYAGKSSPFKVSTNDLEDSTQLENRLESMRHFVEQLELQQQPDNSGGNPLQRIPISSEAEPKSSETNLRASIVSTILAPIRYLTSMMRLHP